MMDEWLPLPKIARLCELPESSARRYALALGKFIPQRRAGRLTLYKTETASHVLTRAAEMFGKGMRLPQVKKTLESEMVEINDLVVEGEHQPDLNVSAKSEILALEFMRSVNDIRADFVTMGASLERIQGELLEERRAREALVGENSLLRQKLGVLEKELVRLRKDRRELESYLVDKLTKLSNK